MIAGREQPIRRFPAPIPAPAARYSPPCGLPSPRLARHHRHRRRDHRGPGPGGRRAGPGGRRRLRRAHPVLPPTGLGRARPDRDLGRGAGHAGRGGRTAGRRRPGGPGHRHHQPARDRGGLGPAHRRPAAPGHRLAGPPDRGRLPGPGRGRPPPAGPGAHRARPRPVLLGHQDAVAPRTRAGSSPGGDLAFGTVDAWVLWNLTGGADGGVFATDATNASRTMLFDIVVRRWSAELCDLFGVPDGHAPRGPAVLRPAGPGVGVGPRRRLPAPGGAHQRDGRRPARRPLRPGLLRPGA